MLEVTGLKRVVEGQPIIEACSFTLERGQVLFITGPSGCGKTLLMRSIACLDKAQAGTLLLHGKTPEQIGFPTWRAHVMYVPQARVALKGTPTEFYFAAQQFHAQRGRPRGDLLALAHDMGLAQSVLNQQWSELSGGQAQRVMLCVCAALQPDVLLLDEPTSACDPVSTKKVEKALKGCGVSLIWITHDPEQPYRVGGSMLELPTGRIVPLPPPPPLSKAVAEQP
uniref:ABC transporter domain-containing protein n=1 Tax=Dunaliella tertiolecta TaxID=3047 RepID=A0A7S3VKL1_DUNTE|mmetsp:Transcript_28741/g.77446  ORF Transcript_28741/g.77446 Transcript_28741/m.77446 type:complete len:225 (+) Transcript_28741:173-847(+)